MKIQFKWRWLFWIMLIAALLATNVFQFRPHFGTQISEIEVIDNDLELNQDGTVSGQLVWCFTEDTEPPNSDFPPFVICQFANVRQPELAELSKGDRFEITFRPYKYGFLKNEDPYKIFLSDILGVDSRHIADVTLDGLVANISIDSQSNRPPSPIAVR